MDKVEELLTRGVANIIPGKEDMGLLLRSGKKLNIYLGIDPTNTKIHLGHAVQLRKIQAFANLGHYVTMLIGDFTALVGDTSDKDSERPILTSDEIELNFQTYKTQAEKIIDFSKVTIKRNSEWLAKLSFTEIIKLTQEFSLNDFISRELIKKRLSEGKRVRLDEALYPLLQGYDSYHMETDVQIGGTDQTFNMQAGRVLIRRLRDKESFILATEFLMGTDGRKMSKSWGNAIWLNDSPEDMYAKILAINDDVIVQYFTLATSLPLVEIAQLKERLSTAVEHPMQAKKKLAHQIILELFNRETADTAASNFTKIVQEKEQPENIKTMSAYDAFDVQRSASLNDAFKEGRVITDILLSTDLAISKSDAKRLVEQGGVEVNDKKITDPREVIGFSDGMIIKVGKRKFVKITFG